MNLLPSFGGTDGVRRSAPKRRYLYLTYAALVALYYGTARVVGLPFRDDVAATAQTAAVLAILMVAQYVIAIVAWSALVKARSFSELRAELRRRLLTRSTAERLIWTFPLTLLILLFFDAFMTWKQSIPLWASYSWDPALADVDRWLHLGVAPWRWTHGLPGSGWLTPVVDWLYLWGWWAVTTVLLFVMVIWDDLERRLRFLIAHALTWGVGGTAMAILTASGGPIFYERLTEDPGRFAGLTERLDALAPVVMNVSARLWEAFETGLTDTVFSGISAMPSMHVAGSVLATLWGWSVHRWLGAALGVEAVLTMLGSVHLGWHYAIDGYVGAAVAGGCWWVAGWWCRQEEWAKMPVV